MRPPFSFRNLPLHQRFVGLGGGWVFPLVPADITKPAGRGDILSHIAPTVLAGQQVLGGALIRRG